MRTTPLVGRKTWFGSRGFGWRWEPTSWEGWVSSLSVFALAIWPMLSADVAMQAARPVAVCALLLVLCAMKGTSPGGPNTKAEYERLRLFPGGRAEQRLHRQNTPHEVVVQDTAQHLRAGRKAS